jgi:hypothetical protein
MSKIPKIIAFLLSCFVLNLIICVWVQISYASNLPTVSEEKTGHIYRMVVNHGFIVYGTEKEFKVLRWSENTLPIAIACFLCAMIIGLRYGIFKIAPGRKWNE